MRPIEPVLPGLFDSPTHVDVAPVAPPPVPPPPPDPPPDPPGDEPPPRRSQSRRVRGMVRTDDPDTSVSAAESLVPHLSELHTRVLDAFRAHGVLIDERFDPAVGGFEQFRAYAYSTVRKRRTELYQRGLLVVVGEAVNSRGRTMQEFALREECEFVEDTRAWRWLGHSKAPDAG